MRDIAFAASDIYIFKADYAAGKALLVAPSFINIYAILIDIIDLLIHLHDAGARAGISD